MLLNGLSPQEIHVSQCAQNRSRKVVRSGIVRSLIGKRINADSVVFSQTFGPNTKHEFIVNRLSNIGCSQAAACCSRLRLIERERSDKDSQHFVFLFVRVPLGCPVHAGSAFGNAPTLAFYKEQYRSSCFGRFVSRATQRRKRCLLQKR